MENLNLQVYKDVPNVMVELRERLAKILTENKNACVKINGRLEITRPVALALQNEFVRRIVEAGGSVEYEKTVLSFSPVVVKATCKIHLGNSVVKYEALGSAEEGDINRDKRVYHDTLGTAETRATKRLLEEMVGEDFINRILVSSNGNIKTEEKEKQPTPITDKQVAIIKILAKKTNVEIKDIVKELGIQASSLKHLTLEEGKKIIDRYTQIEREMEKGKEVNEDAG